MEKHTLPELIRNQFLFTQETVTPAKLQPITDWILESNRVFLIGKGRTGLVTAMFAMRLTQMGLSTHLVGEPTTPALQPEDLLILASGSGETEAVLSAAKQAGEIGAKTFCFTMHADNTLSQMSGNCLVLPVLVDQIPPEAQTKVLMGTLYEQSLLLVFDQIITELMKKTGENYHSLSKRHANIE